MSNQIKISVIIPIYNAERYIERCVRSLMEQTMKKNIEFIFVNDCTPDKSITLLKNIIKEYPNRTEQITIIENTKNMGPSDSRKIAINTAKGEYIACCDSDDWIEPEMYETMYQATNQGNIDIVVCNYRVEEGNQSRNCIFIPSSTPQDALAMLHECSYFPYAMWNQLIRRKYILEQIEYIIPTRIREDTYLMMRVYYHAKNISFVPGVYYHYFYENSTSLVHNYDDSYQAWLVQKRNMDNITEMLYQTAEGYKEYHYAMNNFKYARKIDYKNAFSNLKQFYNEYRETHGDFVLCDSKKYHSSLVYLKLKLIYDTNYFIFNLYHSLTQTK